MKQNDHPRYQAIIAHNAIPRGSIESFRHASIDGSLKDLRNVSRRAVAFSTTFSDELQLLERIYYKGKNQHRSALFWRKVMEIRRIGSRIHELNLPGVIEDLRYSFYAQEDRNKPKILRGAWRQTPDGSTCASLLRRLKAAYHLVELSKARLRVAHQTFTQQIRMATFIPLAICLIAITSRLDLLVSELHGILTLQWQAIVLVFENLPVSDTDACRDTLSAELCGFLPLRIATAPDGARYRRSRFRPKIFVEHTITEDFGSKLSRDPHSPLVSSNILPSADKQTSWNEPPLSAGCLGGHAGHVPQLDLPLPRTQGKAMAPETERIPASELFEKVGFDESQASGNRHRAGRKRPKIKDSNMNKKRDEIDDIFGC